jgi:hypothetical protein
VAHSDTGICYECDAECVGAVFCGFGGQDSPDVRLPKVLNVAIQANPEFWGFDGVLFSGDITYSSSKFDYWNNFEENWLKDKNCALGNVLIRDLDNEERPDVQYRSVYDPDTGTTTYDGNTEIDELGGPSVYLIDRDATKFTDGSSCDESDPDDVFRFHPENFGFGNKILFEEDIYKNISAAWRGADTGIPNFTFNESGLPDGAVVGQYAGNVTGVYRDTATDPFIHLQVQYTGGQASAIRNGQILYLNSTCANQAYESQYLPDGAYYLTKVTDNGSYTDCALVGSVGTEDFSESLTSSTWTIAGSLDEQTCRSRRAHGVDYENKCADLDYNYHADLGVVINDSRNRIHSNRKTRDKFGVSNIRSADDKPRRDYTYVSVQESGYGLLVKEEETDNVALVCETGIWNPTWDFIYTSGDDYYSAFKPEDLFSVSGYHSDAPSTLVNIGSGLILTCGCTSGEPLGLCDISTGCLPLGWSKYAVSSGMYPIYGRELPFYGPFYEVYDKDNAVRNWQQDNTIKARNQTCYTPLATLEVYPDCITQENNYQYCNGGTTNLLNHVSRLAFVYRCFDYQEPCSYDESGRPYDGAPTGIDDLRRGLAGQEVYMYINWGDAWAGEIKRNPCGCGPGVPPGNQPPIMLPIKSPVTFPCFPKFDLNPSDYGAQDQIWKKAAAAYLGIEDGTFDCDCPIDATGDYVFLGQPYTTYGFIRNVCGKETNSSKEVIQALNDVNAGTYRDTTPLDDTVEPMYWEFPIVYGDLNGTPVPWNSGLSGGFVNDGGTLATWGIVDGNNRVVAPYYPVTSGVNYNYCNPATVDSTYADFDKKAAFRGEWPTSDVPFLITIDHDNSCVGCGMTNMDTTHPLSVSFHSLDGSYYHNNNYKYGHNNCPYNYGYREERNYICPSGGWASGSSCAIEADFLPYTGETCETVNAFAYPFVPNMLEGTQIPKYWSTQSSSNSENAFVPVPDLVIPAAYGLQTTDPAIIGIGEECPVFASVTMDCGAGYAYSIYECIYGDYLYGQDDFYNPLSTFYNCGDCSHSYPGVNHRTVPQIDYFAVNSRYIANFANMTTRQIYQAESMGWLCNGIGAGWAQDELTECGLTDSISTDMPGCSGSEIIFYGCLFPGIPDSGLPGCEPCGGNPCGFIATPNSQMPGDCILPDYLGSGFCNTVGPGNYNDSGCVITDDCGNITDIRRGDDVTVPIETTPNWKVACTCHCYDRFDEIASYVHNGTDWVLNWHNCPSGNPRIIKAFSGFGIPGIGDIGPLPRSEPIACRITSSSLTNYCEWKDNYDPNRFTYVDYKINPPGKHSDVRNDSPCGELWPNYCDEQWGVCNGDSNVYNSTCLTPIYGDDSVRVRRKRAYPEIMTVHKIDCLGEGSGYNLHVSREYHKHSRIWTYPIDGYTCDIYNGAVEGGGYNWRRSYIGPGEGPCPSFYFHPCSGADLAEFAQVWPAVDTGDPNYNLEGPFPSYYLLPHSTPSDQVTPAYPTINNSAISTSQSLCSYHPHSGSSPNHSVTRDFRYTIKPYNAKWEEYIQVFVSGDSGAVPQQLPLYTGVIDPPDTGVYGDYCDVISNTGELVNIWIPRGKVFLDSDIENGLQDAESGVYTAEFGEFSCSGIGWAIAGPALKQYDYGNRIRYFAADALATSQCDTNQRYPDLSGVTLWNYYNLFYGSGDPDSKFYNYAELIIPDEEGDCNDPGRQPPPWNFYPTQGGPPGNTDDPHFGPIYNDATDIPLNRRHSCIQDSTQCGGELWNNKMFFPRKPYEAGTRVTAFGALSLCTQDTTYETASWLEGYEDLSTNGTPDILREALQTRFIDACDTDAHSVTLQSSAGIDDVIIHVSDYLPLLGMYFVDRKMNLGDYTCLQPDNGCYDFLPIHSDQTLDKMSFVPAKTWSNDKEVSFGYYLDKLVTDAQDQCLFKPFKIMVDVDCCPDTIRKVGQEDDIYEPTFMQWIDTDASNIVCRAFGGTRDCRCSDTQCGNVLDPDFFVPSVCGNWYTIAVYNETSGVYCFGTSAESNSFMWYSSGAPCTEDSGIPTTSYFTPSGIFRIITGPDYVPSSIGPTEMLIDPVILYTECPGDSLPGGGGSPGYDECYSTTPPVTKDLWEICGYTCELSGSGEDIPGHECSGYYYFYTGPTYGSGCCSHLTYCDILSGPSLKFGSLSDCAVDTEASGYLNDWRNCDCSEFRSITYYDSAPPLCEEKHNILITISEDGD